MVYKLNFLRDVNCSHIGTTTRHLAIRVHEELHSTIPSLLEMALFMPQSTVFESIHHIESNPSYLVLDTRISILKTETFAIFFSEEVYRFIKISDCEGISARSCSLLYFNKSK